MSSPTPLTVPLGDLIVAAFDRAMLRTPDPREATLLATLDIHRLLRRSRDLGPARHASASTTLGGLAPTA
jgi:hypothetical protein